MTTHADHLARLDDRVELTDAPDHAIDSGSPASPDEGGPAAAADECDASSSTENAHHPAPAEPLTDDELVHSSDLTTGVYLTRPSNTRMARLLRNGLTRVVSARRGSLPAGHLKEGRVLTVFGEPRAGKSASVQRLLASVAALKPPGDGSTRPLVDIQIKGPATLSSVGLQILQALEYETEANLSEGRIWQRVYSQLKAQNVLAIHLGEFANVSGTANALDKIKLRNTIKSVIINELHPMMVILSGLPEIVRFLCEDAQIKERAAFVGLERLQPEDASTIADGIRQVADVVGLGVDDDELETEIVPRLIHAARHQLGRAMEFTVAAALRALAPEDDDGSRLPPDPILRLEHFASHYEDTTGNAAWANPFSARDWDTVDPDAAGLVFTSQLDDDPSEDPPASKKAAKTSARKAKR